MRRMEAKHVWILIGVIAFVALLVLLAVPAFHAWNARRVNDIREQYLIQDAHVRIASYEWFYSQYGEIKATYAKVKLLEGKDEQTGVRLVLQNMIAEYNAKSKMSSTKALWKADDLPYQIIEKELSE